MTTTILLTIVFFLAVILLLVSLLLFAKARLSPSGKLKLVINGERILSDAQKELDTIRQRFAMDWADPCLDAVG